MNLPPLPFEPRPVPRLARPSREEVWARVYDEPLILTGCLERWSLVPELKARRTHEEKLAYLAQLFGEQPVRFMRLPRESGGALYFPRDLRGDPPAPERVMEVKFPAFVDRLLPALQGSGDFVYLQSHGFEKGTALHQALEPGVLSFLREEDYRPRLWIGSNGNVTPLHYDEFGNFICMADGIKRVTMFAPDMMPNLYPMPFDRMLEYAQASGVRLLQPDFERFPRLRDALPNAYTAILEPGDCLLIPPMWWHHVESFGLNVMVNNWVFLLPIPGLLEIQKNLNRAVRMFHGKSAAERQAAQRRFHPEAFGSPGAAGPAPARLDDAAEALLRETRELLAPMHSTWRKWQGLLYDQFAFQRFGDPYPALPGELAALLARRAASQYLCPNGDEAEEIIRQTGELKF